MERKKTRYTLPRALLHVEGLLLLAAALTLYAIRGHDWLTLAILFLAPDLSAAGYLLGRKAGAIAYNAVHTYAVPLALGILALLGGWSLGVQLALIWLAHIGMDRFLGFGLKYPEGFRETHLGRA